MNFRKQKERMDVSIHRGKNYEGMSKGKEERKIERMRGGEEKERANE